MKKTFLIVLIFFLFLTLCMIYARFIEPERLVVRHLQISSPKFPQNFSGLRLVHLSDLHISSTSQTLRSKVIGAVRREQPDVIIITGDLVGDAALFEPALRRSLMNEINTLIAFLDSLPAPRGIYIVRGNHDIGNDKEVSDLPVNALRRRGHTVLINQKHRLLVDGQPIHLLGVDYSVDDLKVHTPFSIERSGDNRYLQSGASQKNSYSHYYYRDPDERWQDYTMSARLYVSEAQKSGIGVTFYSQLHKGLDHYYRLRWSSTQGQFMLSPHNTVLTGGEVTLPVTMQADRWYKIRVRVTTMPQHTRMAAKVWPDDAREPDNWQAVACDSSATRLISGAVGFWSIYQGAHRFDDLLVVADNGDTLIHEDWQSCETGTKPPHWIDFRHNHNALPLLRRGIADSCFTILLNHTAELFVPASECGIDLMLCGHTHGGQVRLPLLGAPHLLFDGRYTRSAGRYRLGTTTLYVNSGLGTVYLPVRFLAPPEMTVIELSGKMFVGRKK